MAKAGGGRLLGWRVVVRTGGARTLEVRYLLADDIARTAGVTH